MGPGVARRRQSSSLSGRPEEKQGRPPRQEADKDARVPPTGTKRTASDQRSREGKQRARVTGVGARQRSEAGRVVEPQWPTHWRGSAGTGLAWWHMPVISIWDEEAERSLGVQGQPEPLARPCPNKNRSASRTQGAIHPAVAEGTPVSVGTDHGGSHGDPLLLGSEVLGGGLACTAPQALQGGLGSVRRVKV